MKLCRLVIQTVGNRHLRNGKTPEEKQKALQAGDLVRVASASPTPLSTELLKALRTLLTKRIPARDLDAVLQPAFRACYAETSLYGSLAHLVTIKLSDRRRLVRRLFSWGDEMENRFKYLTAAWAARSMHQELPSVPKGFDERWLYAGITGSRMRRFLDLRTEDQRLKFFQAMLMAKRATAPVPESFVDGEYEAHEARLTTPPAPLPYWFAAEIKRTVEEVFPRKPFRPRSELLLPSERAHFGHCGVADGGAFGKMVQTARDSCHTESSIHGVAIYCQFDQILAASVHTDGLPELLEMRERAGRTVEIRGFGTWVSDNVTHSFTHGSVETNESVSYDPTIEPANAAPSAVLEACKVRMITKGPVKLQWLGRYLQKFLWSTVRSHATFRLIGQPLTEADIDSFWGKCPTRSWWLSGDYKAATDYLSADASNLCWEAIMDRCELNGFWGDLGERLLTGHTLWYDQGTRAVQQRNGQLMGSVVSFPILCLVNACVNRYVMEQAYDQRFSLLDTGMLINGDDCLLHLPPSAYGLWQACTSAVGLKMSVGKNYFSDRFVVINSRTFVPRGTPWSRYVGLADAHKIRFINPGNLHGVGRVLSSVAEDSKTGFLSRCGTLVDNAPQELRDELIDTWVYLNAEKLKDMSDPRQSWFLPRFAGGLGLPQPSWFTVDHCSVDARKVMRYLCGLTGQEFLGGLALETPNAPCYASRGAALVGKWCEKLGMKPILVREDEMEEYLRREEERSSFGQFALWGYERDETRLKHFFQKCLKQRVCRDIEPADGLPAFGRCLLRPALSVRNERFDIDAFVHFVIHGRSEAALMQLDTLKSTVEPEVFSSENRCAIPPWEGGPKVTRPRAPESPCEREYCSLTPCFRGADNWEDDEKY
jgi:hypothetical protein